MEREEKGREEADRERKGEEKREKELTFLAIGREGRLLLFIFFSHQSSRISVSYSYGDVVIYTGEAQEEGR